MNNCGDIMLFYQRSMHGIALIPIWLVFFALGSVHAQPASTITYTHPDLRAVLLSMVEVDEEVRSELIEKGMGNLDDVDFARQQAVDEALTKTLLKIISRYGWPTSEMVGKEGVYGAYIFDSTC